MARVPMVTRTVKCTVATVLCLDIEKREAFEQKVVISRVYSDNRKLWKKIEEVVNTDNIKANRVIRTEIQTTLYGMSEQKFIETAEVLPSRK